MTKTQDLKTEIDNQIKTIIDAADATRRSAAFQAWIKCAARFHKYSAGNVFLIAFQRPDATMVAGYRRWQTMGRQVRRGEHGITILAPVPTYAEITDELAGETRKVQTEVRFTGATVFDVSQTDGEPLPPEPDWRGNGRQPELESLMLRYAHSLGIKGKEYNAAHGPAGWWDGRSREIHYNISTHVCRTVAHELAHSLTEQQRRELGKNTDEPLTDLAAAIVCEHYGVEVTDTTAAYIATWTADPKALLSLADRAQQTARRIIEGLDAMAAQPDVPTPAEDTTP